MGGAVILMAVLTGIYGCVWNGYFNKLIEFPFWRRGNWLMIALYAGILFFFLYTYGGFRIGYLKKGNLLCFPDTVDRAFKYYYLYTNLIAG